MKGCSIGEFIDNILSCGGPEIEFVFRDKFYFLETMYREKEKKLELHIDEYDNNNPKEKVFIRTISFWGSTFAECVREFEKSKIFDGLNIYEAEAEIEVLFG